MGFLDFIFRKKEELPFQKTIRFTRIEAEIDIKIGYEPKIWNKPNSNQIYLYSRGSIGGNGLIGVTYNSFISHQLRNTEYLFIETKIVGVTVKHFDLYVKIFKDKEAVIQNQENQKAKWIESLQKKYNPKTNWELRFFSKKKIPNYDLRVNVVSRDCITDYYEKLNEAIWLIDSEGVKIEAENNIRNGGTEKTLRAVYSGHELEIKQIKKEDYWYYLEVRTKRKAT